MRKWLNHAWVRGHVMRGQCLEVVRKREEKKRSIHKAAAAIGPKRSEMAQSWPEHYAATTSWIHHEKERKKFPCPAPIGRFNEFNLNTPLTPCVYTVRTTYNILPWFRWRLTHLKEKRKTNVWTTFIFVTHMQHVYVRTRMTIKRWRCVVKRDDCKSSFGLRWMFEVASISLASTAASTWLALITISLALFPSLRENGASSSPTLLPKKRRRSTLLVRSFILAAENHHFPSQLGQRKKSVKVRGKERTNCGSFAAYTRGPLASSLSTQGSPWPHSSLSVLPLLVWTIGSRYVSTEHVRLLLTPKTMNTIVQSSQMQEWPQAKGKCPSRARKYTLRGGQLS